MTRPVLELVVWAALVAACAACAAGCKGNDVVAELAKGRGDVRAQGDGDEPWMPARIGQPFRVGGAVETGEGASARVKLVPEGGLRLGENSRVRFGQGERRVGLEIGGAEIEAGDEGVSVFTELGEAEIEPASRVAVRVEDGELRFEVLVGAATIEERGGAARELAEGDVVEVGDAPAVEEPADAGVRPAEVPPDAGPEGITAAVTGDGARIRGEGGEWSRLEEGTRALPIGAEITLESGSAIELSRGDSRARIRGEAELTVGGPAEPIAVTSRGRARLSAGESDVVLEVPGGAIVARGRDGGSRADVAVDETGRAQVTAGEGRVEVEGARGSATLAKGERASVSSDGRVRPARELAPPPAVADFAIRAGESPIVHAPRPPVAVRIRYPGACAGGGIVELAADRAFESVEMISSGAEAAIVGAPRGIRHYRVRCLEGDEPAEIQARGTLRVRRNRGTAPLPQKAPHTRLEADGRRYTVHYQNRLPRLTFVWPGAPVDDARLLVVSARGERRSVAAPGGERTVRSGALGEGEYRWWFQAADDEAIRSPRTPLTIAFDNAADSAHVIEPGVGESWDRSAVRVRGVTLEGWGVSAGGRNLDTDDQRRFSATVSLPDGERALAIRFAHPERGVHYYLRRPGGG